MKENGATRFYAKRLAPNDNSKNQIYLGGDFSALNIIPYDNIYIDNNQRRSSKRDRAKASVFFSWVDENGRYRALNTQLILYPKYPEVRLSGFLVGCNNAPSQVMSSRDEGRVLFLGITHDGQVLGYAAGKDHPLAKEIDGIHTDLNKAGVLLEITPEPEYGDTKQQLLSKLKEIWQKEWILSQKLGPNGSPQPYSARNGGGYTLEAELGIRPNGYSEPDFMGWEIKQYGVKNFIQYQPKSPVTLMTPEPTGGDYACDVSKFIETYGYEDKKGNTNRRNFGGIYKCGSDYHKDTKLKLDLKGYDSKTGKITDLDNGGIALLTKNEGIAALWKFTKLLEHWNRKHARAAYVPSMHKELPSSYCYGSRVLLCEHTDFISLFLRAVSQGIVYYDPGIKKIMTKSGKWEIKRRSQFRIKHNDLNVLYKISKLEFLNLYI